MRHARGVGGCPNTASGAGVVAIPTSAATTPATPRPPRSMPGSGMIRLQWDTTRSGRHGDASPILPGCQAGLGNGVVRRHDQQLQRRLRHRKDACLILRASRILVAIGGRSVANGIPVGRTRSASTSSGRSRARQGAAWGIQIAARQPAPGRSSPTEPPRSFG